MQMSDEERSKLNREYFISLNDGRLLDAREAIRACLLINGGAATAVLAFSAQLASKSCAVVGGWKLSAALTMFGVGVASAAIAFGSAYVTNSGYANALLSDIRGEKHKLWSSAHGSQAVAQIAFLLSIVFFVIGAVLSAAAI